MAGPLGADPRLRRSKRLELPLFEGPLKSIASHPFYGSFLYISEIIVVINPRWVLLYHSHWLLLVTWDFRRWSHRSWLVRSMLHCYRVDFYKTFSPWKGLIWNLQTFNLVAAPGFEPGIRGYEPQRLPLPHATISYAWFERATKKQQRFIT